MSHGRVAGESPLSGLDRAPSGRMAESHLRGNAITHALWLVSADDRDRAAEDRDRRAVAHDVASDARDDAATLRDQRSLARERGAGGVDLGAVADRVAALRDRRGSRADRIRAADDRLRAASDRAFAKRVSSIDELTSAYRRDAGTLELTRDIARAMRTSQPYVVAFVDVDNLKQTNDSLGHRAGDELLRRVVASIRAHLRSYDVIVRVGGDEFVCGLADLTLAEAVKRFSLVNTDLGVSRAAISFGVSELTAYDTVDDLITRADAAMYEQRRKKRSEGIDLRSDPDHAGPSTTTTRTSRL